MNPLHARVLLVSSSAAVRQTLRATLNELTVSHYDEASEGRSAFTRHQTGSYDLVVAEWDLPQLSGIELLRMIRRGLTRPQTLVLLMTRDQVGARTVEALQAGANGLVELPLDAQRAREKLKRLIGSLPEHAGRGAARAADLWTPSVA